MECHFPYEYPSADIDNVLKRSGLPMIGLNTALGPEGAFGIAAITGQEEQARLLIDQAIEYAKDINAKHINVVAGLTGKLGSTATPYIENLQYACEQAAVCNKTIMIEPLNPRAVPDYHFSTVEKAVDIIKQVGASNMKLMFDFFHAQVVQGDLETLIGRYVEHFAHVQISAVHDRGEPDIGEINYPYMLAVLEKNGYQGYIGAEYKPRGDSVEAGLSWLDHFRRL